MMRVKHAKEHGLKVLSREADLSFTGLRGMPRVQGYKGILILGQFWGPRPTTDSGMNS